MEPRFYFVSEHTRLRASVEAEQQGLASHEVDLAETMLVRLAWHFGVDSLER